MKQIRLFLWGGGRGIEGGGGGGVEILLEIACFFLFAANIGHHIYRCIYLIILKKFSILRQNITGQFSIEVHGSHAPCTAKLYMRKKKSSRGV